MCLLNESSTRMLSLPKPTAPGPHCGSPVPDRALCLQCPLVPSSGLPITPILDPSPPDTLHAFFQAEWKEPPSPSPVRLHHRKSPPLTPAAQANGCLFVSVFCDFPAAHGTGWPSLPLTGVLSPGKLSTTPCWLSPLPSPPKESAFSSFPPPKATAQARSSLCSLSFSGISPLVYALALLGCSHWDGRNQAHSVCQLCKKKLNRCQQYVSST